MSDSHTDTLDELLKKLSKRFAEDQESQIPLTKNEVAEVRRMVAAYRLVISWGKLGKILIWIVMTMSGVFLAYESLIKPGGSQ